MKKIIIPIALIGFINANAQINLQNSPNTNISNENPFLDASGFDAYNNSIGKGLSFPHTDLRAWEFKIDNISPETFSSYFDGMIVYNTGEGAPTTDASIGGKRSNLERGFYYFKNPNQTFPDGSIENGEWVRISDAQANESLWKKQDNGDIKLVDADFPNNTYYQKNGGYIEKPINLIPTKSFSRSAKSFVTSDSSLVDSETTLYEENPGLYPYSSSYQQTHNMVNPSSSEPITGLRYKTQYLTIDSQTNSSVKEVYQNELGIIIDNLNTNDYTGITANRFSTNHSGKGNVNFLSTNSSSLLISPESKYNRAYVNRNILDYFSDQNANALGINDNELSINQNYGTLSGSGNIKRLNANTNLIRLQDSDTSYNSIILNRNSFFLNNYTGGVYNLIGESLYFHNYDATTPSITNMYGLIINDVNLGQNNYAIYTKKGINRFGDDIKLSVSEKDTYYSTIGKVLSNGSGLSFKAKSKVGVVVNYIDFDFYNEVENTQRGVVRFFRATNLESSKSIDIYKGNGSSEVVTKLAVGEDSFIANEQGINFGVGTMNPSEKLEVAGTVKATKFVATATGSVFPDYVFEKYYNGESKLNANYDFKTLDQVESFVKTNGHLPGYVSAKSIKEAGQLDMTATQITNVEKIEELYLHTIEQDKAIKAKDAEIKELKSDVQELKTLVKQLLNK